MQSVKELRILLCLTSLDPSQGGIAAVNRMVVRALEPIANGDREIKLSALVYHGGNPQLGPAYAQHLGLLDAEGCFSSRGRFLRRYAWSCLRWRPALVFVDHLHLAVVPYLWSRLLGAPYVLFCHGIEFDEKLTPLRQRAFRSATKRLSNSRFTARRVMGLVPDVVVEPCELGLEDVALALDNQEQVAFVPDAFGRPQALGKRFVLIVSRLAGGERYKGHDQLIAVMRSLIEQIPDAQLIIAGDGDDRERLQQLAREADAGHAICFAGFVSAGVLANLFSRCRLFAMPSRGEGFGLVYLEAMRFAKPCIASRVDAGSEVVADGVSGLLVDPANIEEIRTALARLLCDDELAIRLGHAGLERLNQQYRFSHFRQRLRARLAEVVPEFAV
jgi:phosphatidylinositol alpha-1,6-mannosyltransferase